MKKQIIFIMLVFMAVPLVFSQDLDEIISRHIQALGGIEKIRSLRTAKITGKIEGGSDVRPFTIYISKPSRVRFEVTIQGLTLEQAFDGTSGWMLNPFSGLRTVNKMTKEQSKNLAELSEIEGRLALYDEKGYSAELVGKDDFEGSDVFKIRLTDKDGDVTYCYLDLDSYLILKKSVKRKAGGAETVNDYLYGEYMQFDGLYIPMSSENSSSTGNYQNMRFEKVELNIPVDESIFQMPNSN